MRIRLFGAAGEVTGSAYLVEAPRARVLVDFGMFQGGRDDEARNVVPEGLHPRELDAVVLTHAHIDHTGRVPLLVKAGYRRAIYGTPATLETAELLLRDSAGIQESDISRVNRRRERAGLEPLEPPYTDQDVDTVVERFKPLPYDEPVTIAPGVTVELVEAGHVLGSASIKMRIEEGEQKKTVVFSGDVGPAGAPILRDPGRISGADMVFLESTYGDRDHRPLAETEAEFADVVAQMVARRGKILVPAFAVGRTQTVLYYLAELIGSKKTRPFPIYLDSPLAIKASRIYLQHPELADEALDEEHEQRKLRQDLATLQLCETSEESRALNNLRGPCVIIAGSGMCTGGRILHHLRHNLWRQDTSVLIVGYQTAGSLGRALVEGAKTVTIFGEQIAVRASIHTINGLSAHTGQTGLLTWLEPLAATHPRVALTHGEARGREPLARLIQQRFGITPLLPHFGNTITL